MYNIDMYTYIYMYRHIYYMHTYISIIIDTRIHVHMDI